MNTMSRLLTSSFAEDVGWTLLHSLWQLCVVGAMFAVVNRLLVRRSANLRYLVAYVSLLFMLAIPAATLIFVSSDSTMRNESLIAAAPRAPRVSTASQPTPSSRRMAEAETMMPAPMESATRLTLENSADEAIQQESQDIQTHATPRQWRRFLPWLSLAWLMGVALAALRPWVAMSRCRRLRRLARPVHEVWILQMVESLRDRIGVACHVNIAWSARVQVPTVIGWARPIILLPVAVISGQSPHELSAIIAHELAHVRRHDFALNLFQTVTETLLFYHPVVWWVSAVVRQERENCCDDIAMSICGRRNYAMALANLESARSRPSPLAMPADGGSLYRRIHRIVRPHDPPNPLGRWLAAAIAASTLLMGTVAVLPIDADAVAVNESTVKQDETAETSSDEALDETRVAAEEAEQEHGNRKPDGDLWPSRIRGQVQDIEGRGIAATIYIVEVQLGVVTKPGQERVLHEATTDEDGEFDLSVDLPARDASIDSSTWGSRILQIVAEAEGYGPTATDAIDARQGKSILLKLQKDDIPIEGTVRNLEGIPVAGVTVRVAIVDCNGDTDMQIESLKRQAEQQPPDEMMMSFFPTTDFLSPGFDPDTNERITANQLRRSRFVSMETKTDAEGKFRMRGIGRDRFVALELSGPQIVSTWINVITRHIEPINAARFIGSRSRTTYGATFDYAAEPSQPIVGVVTDTETNEPIEGVRVESNSGTGSTIYVSAVTNDRGEYRLDGLPKSDRHLLHIVPRHDSPYFRQEVRVTEVAEGLTPTQLDLKLRRTNWFSGRIVDKATRAPVAARILYSPRIDNPHAENYSAFIKGQFSTQPFDLDGRSVPTDRDGYFRVRVIPGAGMLFVHCKDREYCTGVGSESLPPDSKWWGESLDGHSARLTNTYDRIYPDWVHRLVPLPTSSAQPYEIEVDPGQTLEVTMVDPDRKPISNVSLVGRTSRAFTRSERPTESNQVRILAISARKRRPVFFYQEARNLGSLLIVPHSADARSATAAELDQGRQSVMLERCATVKGRLLRADGKPATNVMVAINPLDLGAPQQRFVVAQTDRQGRFESKRIIAKTPFQFSEYSSRARAPIGSSVRLEPGEVYDFGDVTLDAETETRPIGLDTSAATDAPDTDAPDVDDDENATSDRAWRKSSNNGASGDSDSDSDSDSTESNGTNQRNATDNHRAEIREHLASPEAKGHSEPELPTPSDIETQSSDRPADANRERRYAGQVVLPNGHPAVGAAIYLVHWFPTPAKELPAKSIASTDREGRFEFTVNHDLYGEATSGTVVAVLKGHAFAWASAPPLETPKRSIEQLSQSPAAYREMYLRDAGPMKLLEDDQPITGRIVDTEGNGIQGVSVHVAEVLGGADHTMQAWDRVVEGSMPDYRKLQDVLVRWMRGPYVPRLLESDKTDADGRFEINGLGRNRIARIVIQGPGIVTESVYARTSGGETVILPGSAAQSDTDFKYTFHGNRFTIVAERSRAVVGHVRDENGEAIANVIVTSRRGLMQSFEDGRVVSGRSGSNDVFAITDAEGRYQVDGLPPSRANPLRFSSLTDPSAYVSATVAVDTRISDASDGRLPSNESPSNRFAPITKDMTLQQGLVVHGRVVDALTGGGVPGRFRFLRQTDDDGTYTMRVSASQIQRSRADGSFQITIPRSAGRLDFTAFESFKYRVADTSTDESATNIVEVVNGDIVMKGTPGAMTEGHAYRDLTGNETGPLKLELKVTPATTISGHAVDPTGTKLSNVLYTGGISPMAILWQPSHHGELKLYGVNDQRPRRVAVLHRGKRLAGISTLDGSRNEFQVQLEPWSTIRGRIVDAQGEPLPAVRLLAASIDSHPRAISNPNQAPETPPVLHAASLPPSDEIGNCRHFTDEQGRFEIAGFVPGETYHLEGRKSSSSALREVFDVARDLKLRSGETRDLGDVVLQK